MSWNDPCSKCDYPRRDCECKEEKKSMTKAEAITAMYRGEILNHPLLREYLGASFVYIYQGIRDHRGNFRADIWHYKVFEEGWVLHEDQKPVLPHEIIKLHR